MARVRGRLAGRGEHGPRDADGTDVDRKVAPSAPSARSAPGRRAASAVARRRGWVPVVIVLVVAAVAIALVRAGTPSRGPLASTAYVGGRLLYVAPDPTSPSDTRLWVWDLDAGEVAPGPELLHDPIELVDASDAGEGWVGVRSEASDGTQWAERLRFLEATDVSAGLLEGDLVAWEPGGAHAVALSPDEDVADDADCPRYVLRTLVTAETSRHITYRGEVCGRIDGLFRSTVSLIALRLEGPHELVAEIGSNGATHITSGRAVGVSRHDLYFLRANDLLRGFALSNDGPGRVYQDEGSSLRFERYLGLTWGQDGALVLGTMDGVRGVYRVYGMSAAGIRPLAPSLVLQTTAEEIYATETANGGVLMWADGRIVVAGDQGNEELDLPEGAPAPSPGPILWLERAEDGS